MFKKVLIAEDYESSNISVQKTLEELQIIDTHFVYYCDDAYDKIKRSVIDEKPFDLLITDLSFDEDYRTQKLKNGEELIAATKEILPTLKTIVFSIEKKSKKIENLFKEYQIDGFVGKGRGDAHELKKAIKTIYKNEKYLSVEKKQSIKSNTIELTSIELTILHLLSNGTLQKNIPDYLSQNAIKPCSLSSVEKTINGLKETFGARSNEQLIALCKDLGII